MIKCIYFNKRNKRALNSTLMVDGQQRDPVVELSVLEVKMKRGISIIADSIRKVSILKMI